VFRSLPRDLPLILSGGSAGGGVAAALAVLACAQGAAPDGVVLHSPWLDQTVSAPSFDVNAASDPLFSREAAELAARLYLQGHDPRDPVASPLLANLADWPPTLVSVGTGEVLRDDAERFSKALAGAGGDCRLMVIAGMDHVAVTRDMAATGAAETFAATVEFIEALLPSRAFQTARGSSRHPGSSPG
jgi:acetyl esterase/lipase